MQKFEVANHEPSFLPEGQWKLVWADEFDGTELDRSKWDFRLNFWGERFDAYTDQGVVLDGNSHIELHRTEILLTTLPNLEKILGDRTAFGLWMV